MNFPKVVVLALAVIFCQLPSLLLAAEVIPQDKPVVKVGNITVSQQELDQELQKLIPMSFSFHGGVKPETLQRLKGEALQNLVVRAYKVQYAIDEEIAVDPKALESNWQNFKAKNAQNLAKVPDFYLSKLRANLYLDLLASNAEQEAVDKMVVIDDAAVKKYYLENEEMYVQQKLYEVSHVFIKVDPASNEEERAKLKQRADDIYERAQNGEDFYNLAYYESDDRTKYVGGKLGSFHEGQALKEFDLTVQKMLPGEIAEPVMTRFGYHVIRLDGVTEKRKLPYEEASVKIKGVMKTKMRQELYQRWLTSLREKYPLKQYEQ